MKKVKQSSVIEEEKMEREEEKISREGDIEDKEERVVIKKDYSLPEGITLEDLKNIKEGQGDSHKN